MKQETGFEDSGMFAAMPFGIFRVDIRAAWTLAGELITPTGQASFRIHDLNTICALTNACLITHANDAARSLIGAEAGYEPLGPIAALLIDDGRKAFVDSLYRLLDGCPAPSFETQLKRPDGGTVHVVISLWSPFKNSLPSEVCAGLTNISGRIVVEEARDILQGELAHAARISMLGEMTAAIAHEINQPLGSIVTNAEAGLRWLLRDEPDIAEVQAILERVIKNGKRAADIITTMRAMARNAKPERLPISINGLVDEAVLILRSELSRRQVSLRLDLAPDLPEVAADRTQILQVIVNLALNAAQAMADGLAWNRTLLIRTRRGGQSSIIVEIEDSGPGVDPKVRDKLFESFYTTKESGVGIGLAICRSIIEAHDSKIELESSPHLGARFSFKLPLPAE